MRSPLLCAAIAASLFVFVAGCDKQPGETASIAMPAAATTPEAAIVRSVAMLKQGDIAGVMQNSMPPADFAKAKADWAHDANEKPITDEDRQKFAETMGKLTAPDADQKLYAEIEPQLKAFDAQYTTQIPMYVAMGSSWLQGMVQQSKDMTDADKQQAVAAINAVGAWVQKTHFTDPESVKKVLAIATKTARDINLKTLDEARALSFDQSMQKAHIAFIALKQALGVYGFDFDTMLDSIKPEVVSNDGKTAKVKVAYTLFDAPLTVETDMVNIDGRWYGKKAIEKLAEEKAKDAAPPSAPETSAPVAPDSEPAPQN